MRDIPQAIEPLECVSKDPKMDHVREMCYVLQFIAQRIFVYLKDIILQEFSPFITESDKYDGIESKSYRLPFSKETIADFVAFFVVCALFGVFFVLSQKYSKDEDHCFIPISENNPPLVDLTEEEENEHDSLYDLPNLSHPWGDAPSGPEKFFPRRNRASQKKLRPYCITTDNESSRHSGLSVKTTQSQHSQSTQTSSMTYELPAFNDTWLVRRTRSGQIYGKYRI